ncbi:MAG: glutamate racemase [Clostridiales Family XIII bacterium]|jgi:glutamate racemase|nr:glutamate racemase [Clostridiales Family XIII bacterium]
MDNRPIGFFDSGLGGLTCIPYLMKALPNERIVYFGDTARTPYGSKAIGTIRNFAFEITDFLVSENVKMIVIACNTISATCLSELRERCPELPILGIISPAARKAAVSCANGSRVGIIGTKVTIMSRAYRSKILKFLKSVAEAGQQIFEAPCPILVPLIEEGITRGDIMDLSIRHYLDGFVMKNRLDTLVLGCTHYPLIKENISQLYPGLSIIDPSAEIISSIEDSLSKHESLADGADGADGGHVFYASDLSENFVNMIDRIFEGSGFTVAFKNFDLECAI